jgi:translation initiation factor IF-2
MENIAPTTDERPPIVVIMGHIDHGKSTLLDYIRKTNIVATESGGITQHISAYEVTHQHGGEEKRITFLDTPGHEAFKGMRSRGARVADIAVLVVSAEDGVKAQTMEAYESIRAAGIPFIVAINKIDKPNADIDTTKQSLAEHAIYVEGYGGDISWVPISAKQGTGVPDLLDLILLHAELAELRTDASHPAEGVVIESNMDPKKGATATVVLTNGTIKKGAFAVAEDAIAPLRIIEDFLGHAIATAQASAPVRITGWSRVPKTGSVVAFVDSKKEAELVAASERARSNSTEDGTAENHEGVIVIPIVIRADVAGTLEAVVHEIGKLVRERARLRVVGQGVGAISEGDVKLALTVPGTIIVGFRTKADALGADLAIRSGVLIETFDIIYKLTERLEEIMTERTPSMEVAEPFGSVKILRFFSQQKDKQVVGARVESGRIESGSRFKIVRKEAEVGEGRVLELQCQKIKTSEVGEGNECGMLLESPVTIAERDTLVPFMLVQKR